MERGTAHFDVSASDFDNFLGQVSDAIAFLRANATELKALMSEPGAYGALDFAVRWRNVAAQFETFPAELVREAGELGISLEVSHYPVGENQHGEA